MRSPHASGQIASIDEALDNTAHNYRIARQISYCGSFASSFRIQRYLALLPNILGIQNQNLTSCPAFESPYHYL